MMLELVVPSILITLVSPFVVDTKSKTNDAGACEFERICLLTSGVI